MNEVTTVGFSKDYGRGRGAFDISFDVNKGEIFGFVGTNGSGKTTTIRGLMGFIRPDKGAAYVKGMDSWHNSREIKKYIGYVPGEIAFPDLRTGRDFLQIQSRMLKVKDSSYADNLIARLNLNVSANLRTMSKGMKQKTAIVNALMADPEILVLDEPSTGLDPLMRSIFTDIIMEEKAKGKTIFMSSHIFQEIEDTCDRLALIRDGRVVDIADMNAIRNHGVRTFKIEFMSLDGLLEFLKNNSFSVQELRRSQNQVLVGVESSDVSCLFNTIKDIEIKFISEIKYTLEKYFDKVFKGTVSNE